MTGPYQSRPADSTAECQGLCAGIKGITVYCTLEMQGVLDTSTLHYSNAGISGMTVLCTMGMQEVLDTSTLHYLQTSY